MTQTDPGAPVVLVGTELPSIQTKGRGTLRCPPISDLSPLQLCVSLLKTCSDSPSFVYLALIWKLAGAGDQEPEGGGLLPTRGACVAEGRIHCHRGARGQGGQAQTHRRALLQMNLETSPLWSCRARGALGATAMPPLPLLHGTGHGPKGEAGVFSDAARFTRP